MSLIMPLIRATPIVVPMIRFVIVSRYRHSSRFIRSLCARSTSNFADDERTHDPIIATPGTLHMVATPIGNLSDMSSRTAAILSSVDAIAAEDTRVVGKLLMNITGSREVAAEDARAAGNPLGFRKIRQTLLVCNEYTEPEVSTKVMALLSAGKSVAFVSDAGTPGVSDPGCMLASAAHNENLPVRAIPGPSAITAAISVAGVDMRWGFRFLGFLPREGAARQSQLLSLFDHCNRFLHATKHPVPLILFEAPHRLIQTLRDLSNLLAGKDLRIVLCRELTKIYEETLRFSSIEAALETAQKREPRGEYVLILYALPAACDDSTIAEDPVQTALDMVCELRDKGVSLSVAITQSAKMVGISKKHLYRAALSDERLQGT